MANRPSAPVSTTLSSWLPAPITNPTEIRGFAPATGCPVASTFTVPMSRPVVDGALSCGLAWTPAVLPKSWLELACA
jgi:hypothetical protein